MIRVCAVVLLALVLLPVGPGAARELWRSGDASLELTGSVRNLARFTQGTDADGFADAVLGSPSCLLAATFPE